MPAAFLDPKRPLASPAESIARRRNERKAEHLLSSLVSPPSGLPGANVDQAVVACLVFGRVARNRSLNTGDGDNYPRKTPQIAL
jgi:hypothetical protein